MDRIVQQFALQNISIVQVVILSSRKERVEVYSVCRLLKCNSYPRARSNSCLLPAARELEARTVIEISPVLLFPAKEYEEHGRYTVVDHYTFKWRDGRMALALGLGKFTGNYGLVLGRLMDA